MAQAAPIFPWARLDISSGGIVGSIANAWSVPSRHGDRSRICEHVGNLLSPQIEPVGRVF